MYFLTLPAPCAIPPNRLTKESMNSVMLAIRNVKNTCAAVHKFPLIIVAPIPMKNVAKLKTISAIAAFQCVANPIIQ